MNSNPARSSGCPAQLGRITMVHLGFFLAGALTVLLGVILPLLAARWSLTDSEAGQFFVAQFLGAVFGVAISSFLLPRRGFRESFAASFLLMGLGSGSLLQGSRGLALNAVFLYGIGLGYLSATTNLWTGEANKSRSAAALSYVNFAWTAGAVTCPLLITLDAVRSAPSTLLWGICALSGILAASSLLLPLDEGLFPLALDENSRIRNSQPPNAYTAILFGLAFFIYVGAENALGGWLATFSNRMGLFHSSLWAVTPSLFWGGLMLGRAVVPGFFTRISELHVVRGGLVVGIAGTIFILHASSRNQIIAAILATGFGLGIVFPVLMAWTIARYGPEAREAAARLLGLGILGGGALSWIVGLISSRFGNLKEGLAVVVLGQCLTLALVSRLGNHRAAVKEITA
ncbi:MAG TPA: MFS transporter [Verrucomicrobiae bacterium]|nr:MFS transporter [Verrucomicrobiae bacterium]